MRGIVNMAAMAAADGWLPELSDNLLKHVYFMCNERHIHRDQCVHEVADGKNAVDAEIKVHNQNQECQAGNGHFYRCKGLDVFLDQPVHKNIHFHGTIIDQQQGEECVQAAHQDNQDGRDQWPRAIPVDIAVQQFILPANIPPPVDKQ